MTGSSTGSPQRKAQPLVVEVSLSKQRCSHAAERGGWASSSSPGAGKEKGWGGAVSRLGSGFYMYRAAKLADPVGTSPGIQ